MRLFHRGPNAGTHSQPPEPNSTTNNDHNGKDDTIHPQHHHDTASTSSAAHKFAPNRAGEGDVAQALFASPDEVHAPIDPDEEKRVVRKIDCMILPYIAVCYAFFYVSCREERNRCYDRMGLGSDGMSG